VSTLLLVHAHPDDESIFGGGAIIRAHERGHRVVLVTCTGGEVGEIHNMDEASSRPRLKEIRELELRRAIEILGVDRLVLLGYRDSGMAGTGDNESPESFNMTPLEETAAKLAAVIEEEAPDVVVTYGPDGIYGHPDHVKAHKTTLAAWELLAARGAAPARLWYAVLPRSGIEEFRRRLEESGQPAESFDGGAILGVPDDEIQAVLDVQQFADRKKAAFQAHVSQNDPSSFFLNTPDDLFKQAFGLEFYSLARGAPPGHQLGDLFEGLAP
jgi:N-acetyl-1-D-myo-inositol-2-amino-2-deoxy-alpha-D-glucopyranoside deacetylase